MGKSALVIQMEQRRFIDEFELAMPVEEWDSYRKQVTIDDESCLLETLDTVGTEEFSELRGKLMQGGEGFIVVYAVNSRATFDEVTKFRDQIIRVKDAAKVPMVICGNKCDLAVKRQVTQAEGEKLARSFGARFFETSALSRINVDESFFELVREIRKARNSSSGEEGRNGGKSKCTLC